MSATVLITAQYDPVIRRYRATCPDCGYVAVRAKREAAEHALHQHVAYEHGKETTAAKS